MRTYKLTISTDEKTLHELIGKEQLIDEILIQANKNNANDIFYGEYGSALHTLSSTDPKERIPVTSTKNIAFKTASGTESLIVSLLSD